MTARTIPTLPTWTAGMRVTGANLAAMVNFQSFWSSPPMFRMYQIVGQSIANATDTQVTCDTSVWDTESGRAGSSPYSYTIPSGMTGRWAFTCTVSYPNAAGARAAFLKRNSTRIIGSTTELAASNDFTMAVGSCTASVSAGDVISLWTWQNSGGALTLAVSPDTSAFEGRLVSLASP